MLPVALFIAFWVVLALVVFFVAGSGGPAGARDTVAAEPRRRSRAFGLTMVLTFVAFGVALPALILHGNHANASNQIGGLSLTSDEKAGRDIFAFRCGICHTLAAANTTGKVGPNLDQLKPARSLVLSTIANGCLENASTSSSQYCLGYGTMPAGIIQGHEANEVASFVARVAGRE